MSEVPVVTLDGPGGAGKGTISSMLAANHRWHLLDSGALYRLTALAAHNHGVDAADEAAVAHIAETLDVCFLTEADASVKVMLEGEDVSRAIRQEAIGNAASVVASIPAVRDALLQRQRDFAIAPGLIADGRDMGTTVFPAAVLKIFLTASAEERARRRMNQLQLAGISANFGSLLRDIQVRDERDQNRSVSPLKPADDAIVLDTTELSIPDVVARIEALLDERLKA